MALIDDDAHNHLRNPHRTYELSQQLSQIYSEDGNSASPPRTPHQGGISHIWGSGEDSVATLESEEEFEDERVLLSRMSTISESD